GLRNADPEHAARGAGRAGANTDEHAGRASAHEMQARRVRGAAAEDDRDRDLAHELLEVEHVARGGDVLGGDDRALDDQDVQAGVQADLVVLLDALRSERGGGDDAVGLDLLDALDDQLFLDRLLVDVLHLTRGLLLGQGRDAGQDVFGVLVAGPDALEVQDRETAELADDARAVGRYDAVHRGR